jgi:enoyl-CoA hydratase
MAYENVMYEVQDNVGVLTFNRPKVLNALNPDTFREVEDVAAKVAADESVRALVLTGAGGKAFIAGADISEFPGMNPLQARLFSQMGQRVCFALERLPVPVIACVNGFALGGGCEVAMSCDFVYASEKSKFGQPEVNLGIMPGFGGTQRLVRLVGRSRAKELCMTGDQISAGEAREIGLVARVFSEEELWDKTMETARSLAKKGRASLQAIKETIDRGYDVDLENGCDLEQKAFGLCFASGDAKEGATAFLEKRKPEFKGTLEK